MEFTDEERALIDEAAEATVKRRLAVPAMMFLETVSPMNTLSASMLHMLTPMWTIAMPASRIKAMAALLERREAIPELIRAIDTAEELRRQAEVAERARRRIAKKQRKLRARP
jgi:predicted aminopeptidase